MERLILLFTLRPIIIGFFGMVLSGFIFPMCGVIVLRNGLIPIRYMLMHGMILGGIIAIGLNLPMVLCIVIINLILVGIMTRLRISLATSSTFLMVLSMGLASLLSHVTSVPSKDTLEILWGSPFALTITDIAIMVSVLIVLVFYLITNFKNICALSFDKDIASSLGINTKIQTFFLVLIVSIAISISMKVLGALLIDALLILPVSCSTKTSKGIKPMFITSTIYGLIFSVVSYFVSIIFNL
ncbi:MAG: metal ABC transporter permease, partial [Sphaerochaetaceae bacterium]|nr:metal ABC transporter permease [Sphaerochaetaceae bacterium]